MRPPPKKLRLVHLPSKLKHSALLPPPSIRTRCASPSTTSTVIGMTESDSMRGRVPPHQRARHDVEFVQDALRFPNPALLEELALAEGQTVEDHAVVEQFVARYLDGSEGGEGP